MCSGSYNDACQCGIVVALLYRDKYGLHHSSDGISHSYDTSGIPAGMPTICIYSYSTCRGHDPTAYRDYIILSAFSAYCLAKITWYNTEGWKDTVESDILPAFEHLCRSTLFFGRISRRLIQPTVKPTEEYPLPKHGILRF